MQEKTMKRTLAFGLLLLALLFTGCGINNKNNDTLKITTTIFPLYDWTASIAGENGKDTKLSLLVGNGTDIHSYQPSAADIITISTSDVFIYVGGESDSWVDDVLKNAANKDMIIVNLLEVLGDAAKEEEAPEGSEPEKEHDEEEEGPEYDEHIWLSLKNAKVCCEAIALALKTADEAGSAKYDENLEAYLKKLTALDEAYEEAVGNAPVKTLLFGDRFPFRYLTDDYGIKYYAAFLGCSAESEASFETVTFLASKTDELGLKSIMVIDSSDKRVAKTIQQNTKTKDQVIRTLDSLQSVTYEDIEKGTTYLSVMEADLEVLKEALR